MTEYPLRLRRKFVPEAELLADLRRVAETLGRATVPREVYTAHGRFNGVTLAKRFGGWGAALAAAGLPATGYRYISDAALFENLAAVWRALGRQPVLNDMHRAGGYSRFSPGTYRKRFGSWNAALLRFEGWQDGSDWRSGSRGDARAASSPGPFSGGEGVTATTAPPFRFRRAPPSPCGAQVRKPPTTPSTTDMERDAPIDPVSPVGLRAELLPAPASVRRRSRRIPGWRLRARVLERDGATCQLCGASPRKDARVVLHVDHIVPWSQGGETVEANLRVLCERCNVGRGDCDNNS